MKNQVHIHICYIITRGDWGGAQRYLYDLATVFAKKAQISIIIGGNGTDDLSEKIKKHLPTANLIHIPSLGRSIHPLNDIIALHALKKTLTQINPDIIHLNSTKVGILGTLASTVVPRAKLLYTVHGWIMNEQLTGIKKMMYTTLERHTAPQKDAYIVLSHSEANIGTKLLHIPKERIHIIPNGIDPAPLQIPQTPIHQHIQDQKENGTTIFLTIANFYHTKGIDLLIDAAAKVTHQNFHIYIAGDGPLRSSIEKQITRHKLNNTITLLGAVPEASSLCTATDYLVIPSRKEGLPYVLLEALRAHTAVICTAVGAIPETLQGVAGSTIIEPNTVSQLTQALDQAILTKKESATPALPIRNTIDVMTQSTWSLYQSLL